MGSALLVLLAAAVLTAGMAAWVLRAYRRAGGGSRSAGPAFAACGAVAMMALTAYLVAGHPELPDAPYTARLEALKHREPTTYSVDEYLAVLAEAGRHNQRDPLPHFYSGNLLLDQGRAREAAGEYDAALRREPNLPEAMLGLGRALVQIENGRVTPEALDLFQRAGGLTDDPAPWIYQAMAAMEAGNDAEVRRLWGEAYRRMSADDPRRAMAQQFASGRR